jgi:hypothetical protein
MYVWFCFSGCRVDYRYTSFVFHFLFFDSYIHMELVDFTITNTCTLDVEEFQSDCRACTWGRFGFPSTRVMPSFSSPHSLLARAAGPRNATPRDSAGISMA